MIYSFSLYFFFNILRSELSLEFEIDIESVTSA